MAAVLHGVHRLTPLIACAVDFDADPRTMALWAGGVNLTEACLRRYCQLAGVHGREALALARAIRAFLLARQMDCSPEEVVDIADQKTLRRFLQRAGLLGPSVSELRAMTLEEILAAQQFVKSPSILASLAVLLASRAGRWST